MNAQFTHTAKMPEAWPVLLRYSASVTESAEYDQRLQPSQANQVLNFIHGIDDATLETARYFGLGEMISPFGQFLDDPVVLDETIELLTDELFSSHFDKDSDDTAGVRVLDIDGINLRMPMIVRADAAKRKVPIEVALLTDALEYTSLHRRKALMVSCQQELPTFADILNLQVSSRDIGSSSLINAATLVRGDLLDTFSRREGISLDRAAEKNPTVRQIRNESGLRKMKLLRVATYLAKLRLDEAKDGSVASACIRRDQSGALQIDTSRVPVNPPPVSNEGVTDIAQVLLHSDRLGCPAVYCAPIIDRMLQILPIVILKADGDIRAA